MLDGESVILLFSRWGVTSLGKMLYSKVVSLNHGACDTGCLGIEAGDYNFLQLQRSWTTDNGDFSVVRRFKPQCNFTILVRIQKKKKKKKKKRSNRIRVRFRVRVRIRVGAGVRIRVMVRGREGIGIGVG